jgi:tetratricopeptide (TPR) repeat protein
MDSGDLAGARRDADALVERAQRAGDEAHRLRARLARANVGYNSESLSGEELQPLAEESLELFTELGDDAGLADAWWTMMLVDHGALRWSGALKALERMIEHAERIGDRLRIAEAESILPAAYMYGPCPVEEAIAWCEAHPSEHPFYPSILAQLEGMRGNFSRARELCRVAREQSRERGQLLMAAEVAMQEVEIELYAEEPQRASELALAGVDELDRLGEKGWLSTVAGHGAEALYRLGRDAEAWRLTETADETGAADDVITQMLILQVRAKILARRGEFAEAERLAREAVAWAEPIDALDHKAASHRDLAIVLAAADKWDEALDALATAGELYEQKGLVVGAARIEELRSELVATLGA